MAKQNQNNETALQQQATQGLEVFTSGENFALAQRVATAIAKSTLVPQEYRGNVSNCLIAMNLANRMNSDVFMIMQNLDIIQGRPSFSSKFLIALVNSSRQYEKLKWKWEDLGVKKNIQFVKYYRKNNNGNKEPVWDTIDQIHDYKCYAYTKETESGEVLEGPPITIETAIHEGWYTKSGSKWKTMPFLMLQYRAAAFWTKMYAPELTMGMSASDEIQDAEIIEEESGIGQSNQTVTKEDLEKELENQSEPDPGEPMTAAENPEQEKQEEEKPQTEDPVKKAMQESEVKEKKESAQKQEAKQKSSGQKQSAQSKQTAKKTGQNQNKGKTESGNGELNFDKQGK